MNRGMKVSNSILNRSCMSGYYDGDRDIVKVKLLNKYLLIRNILCRCMIGIIMSAIETEEDDVS